MEYLITPVLLQSLGHHLGGWRQVGQPLPSHRTCWASPCLVLICYWVSRCHCWGKQDLANGQADQLNSNYLWSHLAEGWLKTCSFLYLPSQVVAIYTGVGIISTLSQVGPRRMISLIAVITVIITPVIVYLRCSILQSAKHMIFIFLFNFLTSAMR